MRAFTAVVADQRSVEWYLARAGRLTGSRAGDMLATIKSGEAAARRDYRMQLVCERITSIPQENGYVNAEMQRGIDLEPAARAAYEAHTGELVRQTGFLSHNELMAGCSLDGDVNDYQGIVELKCPKSATHLRYLRGSVPPSEYMPQITHNLWMTGAQWCDFGSYDDRFPDPLKLFVVRVHRKDLDIAAYEAAALKFLAEAQDETDAVRRLAA